MSVDIRTVMEFYVPYSEMGGKCCRSARSPRTP